ncbi:uroplakin-3b-like protein 1 [Rhynchocyon petersi]
MGLSGGQCRLLTQMLLLTALQSGTSLEHISYVPRLSNATLGGKLTQSTFTLEQPRGQFNHLKFSNSDAIWLVVAHSTAIQDFTAPQRLEDIPAPADLPTEGYYLTIRANPILYLDTKASNQLQLLRVGNNTLCSPNTKGCNYPLPGPGPYRVKFLVMSDNKGPLAETEWSNEVHLPQAQTLQAAPGPQTPGTVVLIAFLSVMLAVLLSALLVLLIYTCSNTCRSTSISGPEEAVDVRKYSTHHMFSPPAVGDS